MRPACSTFVKHREAAGFAKGLACLYDKERMTKRFRSWDPKQKWLLPPEITEFIPEGHPSHFIRDLVVEALDLTAILDTYVEDKGFPPFHPAMMTGLLLYAYTQGVFSSRKIAKGCIERMDFAAVTGFQKPDFRTISLFRKRHLTALGGLFQQVLVLCRQAGLVALGHVALDGTKVKANASRHKAMSYDRMEKAETEFAELVKGWLDQAEITDLGEDYRFRNRQGDELPAWVANKAERMKKIREAKAALEQEAADKSKEDEQNPKKKANNKKKDDDEDPPPPPKPEPKAQRNFTDPESRIMPTKNGFEQCFNAQAAVDAEAQVIVPEDQSLYRHGPPEARHQGRNPCQERQGRKPDREDAGAAEARWLAKSLPAAETSGRTRFRPDQAGDGLPSIPAAGACQGHGRMVDGLHGPQPPETGEGHGMSLGDIVKMLQ